MTIKDAIDDLEARKAFLQRTCTSCWDPAIDLALSTLKEKERWLSDPYILMAYALERLHLTYNTIDQEIVDIIMHMVKEYIDNADS